MNYKKLSDQISILEKDFSNIDANQDVVDSTEKEFANTIIKLSETETSPESEDGKQIINLGNMIRKLGAKILNLLKIEFSISFAGVTIVHLQIPKLDKDLQIKK